MAYLCVEKDGTESICSFKPRRWRDENWTTFGKRIELPHGSIAKLIGRELAWEDEPVMIE